MPFWLTQFFSAFMIKKTIRGQTVTNSITITNIEDNRVYWFDGAGIARTSTIGTIHTHAYQKPKSRWALIQRKVDEWAGTSPPYDFARRLSDIQELADVFQERGLRESAFLLKYAATHAAKELLVNSDGKEAH